MAELFRLAWVLARPVPPGAHYPPRRVTDPDEWARQNRHATHPHNPDRDWNPGEMIGGAVMRPLSENEPKRRANVQR